MKNATTRGGDVFASHGLALWCKKIGYDWPTLHHFNENGKIMELGVYSTNDLWSKQKNCCSCPTLAAVQKFLRENHNLYVSANPIPVGSRILYTLNICWVKADPDNLMENTIEESDHFQKALDYAHSGQADDIGLNLKNNTVDKDKEKTFDERLREHLEEVSGGETYEEALDRGLIAAIVKKWKL